MNLREVVRTLRFERRRVLAIAGCATRYSQRTMSVPPARSASRRRS